MADRMLCLHVKSWTWLIALVELVIAVGGVGNAILYITDSHHDTRTAFIVQLVIQVIWILFILMLVLALIKNRSKLIFPHLLVSVVVVIFFIVELVLFMFTTSIRFWVLVYNAFVIAFVLFCVVAEYRCYKWMKDYVDIQGQI